MRNFLLILIIGGLMPLAVKAQLTEKPSETNNSLPLCTTSELTGAQLQELTMQAAKALAAKRSSNAALTAITYVPIRPHILRRSDGSGGISMTSLNQAMAVNNSYYLQNGLGIQFYFCGTSPDYIDNDAQYNSFSDETAVTQGRDAKNAMNQYYVNSFASGAGGYAYYPGNNLVTTRSFILNVSWNESDMGNRIIPHELGHNFNLIHTFGQQAGNGTLGSGTTLELVTRGAGANCATEGDYICDTPADPYNMNGANLLYVNGCPQYDPASTARDANGMPYSPSITNIMSYYFPCTHDFTPGQYERIQAGLALRQTHTAYSLDCPPTVVLAPDNVLAVNQNGQVLLTWRDNAQNEMGYFIERSTSPTTGFLPVGGVGPNETNFFDANTNPLTTYYYRLRPSNATTTGISQIVSIRTPTCRPTFQYACTYPVGLSSVSINNVPLSQNSGCSPGGYGSFATSTTVLAGNSYPITGKFLYDAYSQGVAIWADLNYDGSFDETKERLFQTSGTLLNQFSTTLTLPSTLATGTLPIRIVTIYGGTPTSPCGTYFYGEVEDYVLNVVMPAPPSADLSLSLLSSSRVVAINQPVSYSLTIRNSGPDDATGISWQNRLPANMGFVTGDASITNSGTAVGASNLSLVSGQSVTFVYQLKASQNGTFVNAAQIMTSNQPDPDSQPGSGTGDGQDDAAFVDLRTNFASNGVYASSNPYQTPLPVVSPNQPTPDSTKADLSLQMAVSQRTPDLGKPVTCTITINNAGGLTATNIVVRDTLRGLAPTTLPAGITVIKTTSQYTIIEGSVATLSSGMFAELIFTFTPTVSGRLTNTAQIWSSATPDPDSIPGSVTPTANNVNGEDDVSSIDLRVGIPQ